MENDEKRNMLFTSLRTHDLPQEPTPTRAPASIITMSISADMGENRDNEISAFLLIVRVYVCARVDVLRDYLRAAVHYLVPQLFVPTTYTSY